MPLNHIKILILTLCLTGLMSDSIIAFQESETDRIQILIKQLGSEEFESRELAESALMKIGLQASDALQSALKSPDLEIRTRARRILVKSLQDDFERKLQAFVNDVEGKLEHDLPGWKRYRQVVGSDKNHRLLFASMVRSEASLLHAMDTKKHFNAMFERRVKALQPAYTGIRNSQSIEAANIAALLFAGLSIDAAGKNTTHHHIYNLLNYNKTMEIVRGSNRKPILVKLLDLWVRENSNGANKFYPLMLTMTYDLKDAGLEIGKATLQDTTTSSSYRQYAAVAIAKFGGTEDIELLFPLLTEKTVVHTWSTNQVEGGIIRTQARDVALALLLYMTRQSHEDYGYKYIQPNPTMIFNGYSCGFASDELRDQAQEKWAKWWAGNKQKVLTDEE